MGFSTKEGFAYGFLLLVGVAAVVGLATGQFSLNTAEGGEDMRSMADATADLRVIADNADTVYMAAPDAEIADEYGDYTADAATIQSNTDGDVYTVDITDGEGTISSSNIGPNQDFVPGETYTVWTDGSSANLEFDEVTIPAETETFKIENEISEEVVVDTLEQVTYGDTEEEILTADGQVSSDDTDVSTGFDSRVTEIYDSGEFTLSSEVEVDAGTVLLGEVSTASAHSDVQNVDLEIMADGQPVYDQSESGSDAGDLAMDFVEDDMVRNPEFASDNVEIVADVEFDDTRSSGDTNVDLVNLTVQDLFGNQVYTATVTG